MPLFLDRRILFILAFGSACGNSTPADLSYPTCSSAGQECLDDLQMDPRRAVPFIRNFSLSTPNPAITQAIIVVHGSDRDAGYFFQTVSIAAEQAGLDGQTLIVAPHFQCDDDPIRSGDVRWLCDGGPEDWSHGGPEQSEDTPAIYSFTVIDRMVAAFADKTIFPNLQSVVVTGLSAGGQFTQRYAATNGIDPVTGIAMKYVDLSPSSYVYLDPDRLSSGSLCQASGGCEGTFVPYYDAAHCPGYDDYHYGLENRTGYVAIPSADDLRAQYLSRDVTYMVGDGDVLANAAGTGMDTSCEANAQGIDRLSRAINFWNAMRMEYQATHPLVVVPGCEHSRTCMYYSLEVRSAIFSTENPAVSVN